MQLQTAITKARASLAKAQNRYKSDFDKRLRKAHDRPTIGGWIFLDPADAISKPSGDDKSKLTHVTEGPYKVLDVSTRTTVIQRGPLVVRVTVDPITPAPAPVTEPESHKYGATPEDVAAKNTDGEAWLFEGLLKH